jgi:hypothetical protein
MDITYNMNIIEAIVIWDSMLAICLPCHVEDFGSPPDSSIEHGSQIASHESHITIASMIYFIVLISILGDPKIGLSNIELL